MAEKHLEDHERAHTGKENSLVRHGQDAVGKVSKMKAPEPETRYHALRNSLDRGLD